jgi:hypothetical protein
MALVDKALVKDTFLTTGTGTVTLVGGTPPTGFRRFAVAYVSLSGSTCHYKMDDGGNTWEEGIGTVTVAAGVATLSRGMTDSSTGAAINWAGGTKNVIVTPPSSGFMFSANNLGEVNAAIALATLGGLPKAGGTMTGALDFSNVIARWNDAIADKIRLFTNYGFGLNASEVTLYMPSNAKLVHRDSAWNGTALAAFVKFPTGGTVKMTFNCAPPTGWSRINVTGERMPKFATASDTPEATGGSWTVSGLTATGNTDGHALTIAQIPSHFHNVTLHAGIGGTPGPAESGTASTGNTEPTSLAGGGGTHSHSLTSVPVSSAGTWRVPYEICVKASFD